MRLARFTVRRLLLLIPVLFGVTAITFLLVRVLPGDPIRTIPARTRLRLTSPRPGRGTAWTSR